MVTKETFDKAKEDVAITFNVIILAVMRHGADRVTERLRARGVTEQQVQEVMGKAQAFVKELFVGLDDGE